LVALLRELGFGDCMRGIVVGGFGDSGLQDAGVVAPLGCPWESVFWRGGAFVGVVIWLGRGHGGGGCWRDVSDLG